MIIAILFFIILFIELSLSPRFDYTREKKLLLWYGRKTRNYIVIF